ncbi:MAG TPA: hypothetical protein PLV87_08455 [Opitutaceae bacterium]|nr:hypothetical protein [Opitutaceae bacterium]
MPLAALACALVALSASAHVDVFPTHGRNIYRLAIAQTHAAPESALIVGSTYDNRVCAFAPDGLHQWDASVGGFIFDLATGDLDGDGRDEIVAAGADGIVTVLDLAGRTRWTANLEAPVYQVAIARLTGTTSAVLAGGISREVVAFSPQGIRLASASTDGIVRVLRAGDFDADGADEVAVLIIRGTKQDVQFLKGPNLGHMGTGLTLGTHVGDPLLSLRSANGIAADLNLDGAAEFIFTPAICQLRDGTWKTSALPQRFPQSSYSTHYTMRLFAQGDLHPARGKELVLIEGSTVRILDSAAREIGGATAPIGFTAAAVLPGSPFGSVILGSSPNGDDSLYRLTLTPGWEESLTNLTRHNRMAEIGSTLKEIGARARQWEGSPLPGADGPFDVIVNHSLWSGWNPQKFQNWIDEVHLYQKRFPYPRLRFATAFWPGENAPLLRPDGKPWSRDRRLAHDLTRAQILAAAKTLEQAKCPFWVQVGHACSPHLELGTVAAMLDAAPEMLMGFISAEDFQPDQLPYYMEHFIRPILELCLKHGKRFIPRNKGVWWAEWPADPRVRELIFNGRYRSVIVPAVEDSNSRSPDVNLAARVGLWLDGQVDSWASRCSADWYSFNRAWEWEYPMTGHPSLRYFVSQALMGARVFMPMNGELDRRGKNWTTVGIEGVGIFLDLLGRGVITPPRRDQVRAVAPVALAMTAHSKRFVSHGGNYHQMQEWNVDGTDAKPWAFDRLDSHWGMAPLPPTDVSTYLWGRTRRDATHLPITAPHGFVAIVPGGSTQPHGPWTSVWTTDGDTLGKEGRIYSLTEARAAISAELVEGTKRLPFQIEGHVLHQDIELTPNRHLLALFDPGWVAPEERSVRITTHLPGDWTLTDRLSGKDLGRLGDSDSLSVPAGAFRLIEIFKSNTVAASDPETTPH